MKLVPKFSSEVEHTLSVLDLMISERKDELDKLFDEDRWLEFLNGTCHKRKAHYAQDIKISQLREERDRIFKIAIPESYSWDEEE
tara:strand:+ start:805 stop:1059 length:255 start_codon:yes stop_codon:yes gene_type:complete